MACDVCGATGTRLEPLREGFTTEKIQSLCPDCARLINYKLWVIRGVIDGWSRALLRRFMVEQRATRFHNAGGATVPSRRIEALAAVSGLLGAFLLAAKGEHAGWGWIAFLASNAAWSAFAILGRHWWLLVQQAGFTASSVLGIWRWLL